MRGRHGRSVAKRVAIWGVLGLAVLLLAAQAGAAIPKKIAYQGKLVDASGNPSPGDHTVLFSLHNAESGGIMVWSETQTVTADSNGVFSAILGSDTPIEGYFAAPKWLSITVDGEPLSPRREIVSVATAFNAGNADSLGGLASSSYSLAGHTHYYLDAADGSPSQALSLNNDGEVHISTGLSGGAPYAESQLGIEDDQAASISLMSPSTTAQGLLFGDPDNVMAGWVVYDHTTDLLRLGASNNNRMTVAGTGRVGIGTTSPGRSLHIVKDTNDLVAIMIENVNTGSTSGEGLLFKDENGEMAGIQTYDDGSVYSGALAIYNSRPDGSIELRTGGARRVVVTEDGDVGVGTQNPQHPLHVETSSATFGTRAIYGVASSTSTTQQVSGILGETRTTDSVNPGAGVWGWASAVTGRAAGVRGDGEAEGGTGVHGWATHDSGVNYGVIGETESPNGYAGYFLGGKNYFEGNVGIRTLSPTATMDVSGSTGYDQVRMRTSYTPTTTTDTHGNVGDMAWDNNFIYIKTPVGWKRAALSTFGL